MIRLKPPGLLESGDHLEFAKVQKPCSAKYKDRNKIYIYKEEKV